MREMLLTVGAQLPHTLGVPSTAPSHCLAVSLPQLGCKIQDEDYILLMATTPPSIWAGAGRTNKENRVLLLRGHELCCVRLFICEEPPPTLPGGLPRCRTHRSAGDGTRGQDRAQLVVLSLILIKETHAHS